jgi:hypothetical protein
MTNRADRKAKLAAARASAGAARRQEIRWIRRIQLLRNFLAAGQNLGGGFSKGAAGPVAFDR